MADYQDYYYAKIDGKSWDWWPTEINHRNDDKQRTLEAINGLALTYKPAKIFVCSNYGTYPYCATIRGYDGVDNVGRTTRFNHIQLRDAQVAPYEAASRFSDPAVTRGKDFESTIRPQVPGAIYDEKTRRIFCLLYEALEGDKPVCIMDAEVDDTTPPSKEALNQSGFQDFPGGASFLTAFSLLPADLQRKLPFLLNYEDNFINQDNMYKMGVKAIFCGTKTLCDDRATTDERTKPISTQKLEDMGYKVTRLVNYQAPESIASVYEKAAAAAQEQNISLLATSLQPLQDAIKAREKATTEAHNKKVAAEQQRQAELVKQQNPQSKPQTTPKEEKHEKAGGWRKWLKFSPIDGPDSIAR